MSRDNDDFACPHCGAAVAPGASFCRECGFDEEPGDDQRGVWSEGLAGEGYDEDGFDYDEFLAREFPDNSAPALSQRLRQIAIFVIVILLCLSLALLTILS